MLPLCYTLTPSCTSCNTDYIHILIALGTSILPGLIIDAFGELRDREEFITMEMQTKCFVCGLPKTEFDHIPHGFDNHITREHNMAHYMCVGA